MFQRAKIHMHEEEQERTTTTMKGSIRPNYFFSLVSACHHILPHCQPLCEAILTEKTCFVRSQRWGHINAQLIHFCMSCKEWSSFESETIYLLKTADGKNLLKVLEHKLRKLTSSTSFSKIFFCSGLASFFSVLSSKFSFFGSTMTAAGKGYDYQQLLWGTHSVTHTPVISFLCGILSKWYPIFSRQVLIGQFHLL